MAEPIIAPEAQARQAYTYENIQETFENAVKTPAPVVVIPTEMEEKPEKNKDAVTVVSAEKSEEKKTPAVKIIKVSSGDKEIDLPEDALIPLKVNGKIEKFTAAEWSRRASGDVSIERRHEELRKKEEANKTIVDKAKVLEQTFANLREVVEKKDFVGFLTKYPEEMGLNPVEFESALLDHLAPIAIQWSQLSKEQKKALVQGQEVGVLKKEKQELETARETERKNREIAQIVSNFCKENNIEQQVFSDHLDELKKLKEEGQLTNLEKITPQTVKDYISHKDLENRTKSALAKVAPNLADDQDALLELLQPLWGQNPSDEDLEEIVRAVHGEDDAEAKLNKKIAKTSTSTTPAAPPKPKTNQTDAEKKRGWNPNEEW